MPGSGERGRARWDLEHDQVLAATRTSFEQGQRHGLAHAAGCSPRGRAAQLFADQVPAIEQITFDRCTLAVGALKRLVERKPAQLRSLELLDCGIGELDELSQLADLSLPRLRVNGIWVPDTIREMLLREVPDAVVSAPIVQVIG